eukprot:TRINITY_DN949_c0_g1_i1.p1 TRINITY_DN949_c0_g1~~TRINITY_DN949_c0_g1_i1.p1  ORF type:complete len:191 (+),score=45.30 TRINITY_DN949_c0_g1_i1:307-879(+)
MDTLAVFASTLCRSVTSVTVERFQDSTIHRIPFQRKIGAGLWLGEWMRLRDSGAIKHVGFTQSLHLIAHAFGWKLDKIEEFVEPVISEREFSGDVVKVLPGQCCGVKQYAYGYVKGERKITLELQAYHGHPNPHDTVRLVGDPGVTSTIEKGVHGDTSTCAIVCNVVPALTRAQAGLRSMADMPLPHWHL